eukprot:COSAG06_NODE_6864_length_2739_cov_3.068561_1_plen_78_part_00
METVTGAGAPRLRFPPVNDAHAASLPARPCQSDRRRLPESWHLAWQAGAELLPQKHRSQRACMLTAAACRVDVDGLD